tara:strand:+ start:395 stop:1285 length:891 start_codon:yes stop_codon:yes gene_type:complete
VTDFDLYLKPIGMEESILYGHSGYLWLKEEIERLLRGGYEKLVTQKTNAKKVGLYLSVNAIPEVDQTQAPNERIRSLEEIGAAFTQSLKEGEVTQSCAHRASKIARSISSCLLEEKESINSLKPMLEKDRYVLHHSVRVSCYAVAIAVTLGLEDETHLTDIALGGLFHDIGKANIDKGILHKKGALTEKEWDEMRSHPTSGRKAVENTFLGEIPKNIIECHHERIDGTGYPNGYQRSQIPIETQLVTLADIYDALTSARPYQKQRSRYESLEFIKTKMLGSHISPEIFMALVNSMT